MPPNLNDDCDEQNQTVVPTLPDDLMLQIISCLTTSQRENLGVTCKRFRELDFEFGQKRFDIIEVKRTTEMNQVHAHNAHVQYNIRGSRTKPIKATKHNMRLFRQARTKRLHILFNKADQYQKVAFQRVSNLLKSVTYENIRIEFDCEQDCSVNFIPSLLKNRCLDKVQVHLSWRSYHSSHSVVNTRKLLLQLPEMDKFRVDWIATSEIYHSDDCLLDDATLLHLTSHSNHTELGMADCTAEGIINTFDMVSQSSSDYKYVHFHTHKSIVEELLAMSNLNCEHRSTSTMRSLVDRKRRSILNAVYWKHESNEYCKVEMGRMNKREKLIRHFVSWSSQCK